MTTLLIDGDIYAYRCAAGAETGYDFDGVYSLQADQQVGKDNLDAQLESFAKTLKATKIIVALSDKKNFRHSVLPTYKSNRKDVRRPLILNVLKEHLVDNYETFIRPSLEADDVLGILATNPKMIKGPKIVITADKDLRTVPALHWNPDEEGLVNKGPTLISEEQADFAFFCQVLSGDVTDGYKGCEGIGKKRAQDIISNPVILERTEEEIKSGKNKGNMREKWLAHPTDNVWKSIVSHYEKAGLTEADALVQARVARILRHEDYNYKTKEPILWKPKTQNV